MKVITWNVNGIRSRIFNSKTNSFKYEENSSMSMILKENPQIDSLKVIFFCINKYNIV